MNKSETENLCGLRKEDFQTTINGKQTDLFILKNSLGNEVAITNYGGAIVAIMVPDRNGNYANVIQGHDNIQDVINSPEPFLSTLIGRYGNRICRGQFRLRGKDYQLAINNGPNALHGGPKGFHARVWDAQQMNDQALVLELVSAYGEEGYTGELKVTVVYTFTNENELMIEYLATTNKMTIINLTSHGFFSLAGIANPTPTIEDLECEINADYYIPIDENSIPTGEIRFVKDTPFDFRTAKPIGRDIALPHPQLILGCGYDHNYVLNRPSLDHLSATLSSPISGIAMDVYTTAPGMQLYTGNFLDGVAGKEGKRYGRRSAVCLETQQYPDSPNHSWPESKGYLYPNRPFESTTVFRFRDI